MLSRVTNQGRWSIRLVMRGDDGYVIPLAGSATILAGTISTRLDVQITGDTTIEPLRATSLRIFRLRFAGILMSLTSPRLQPVALTAEFLAN